MKSGARERRVIIGCTNKDCVRNGAPALHNRLKELIAQAGLPLEFETYNCFGACEYGPNIVLYPQLQIFSGLTPADAPFVLERALNADAALPARWIAELDAESRADVQESLELIQADYE